MRQKAVRSLIAQRLMYACGDSATCRICIGVCMATEGSLGSMLTCTKATDLPRPRESSLERDQLTVMAYTSLKRSRGAGRSHRRALQGHRGVFQSAAREEIPEGARFTVLQATSPAAASSVRPMLHPKSLHRLHPTVSGRTVRPLATFLAPLAHSEQRCYEP